MQLSLFRGKVSRLCWLSSIVLSLFLRLNSCVAQDIDAGRRLFREGVLANGSKLEGFVHGDLKMKGKLVACGKCHRRSGRGAGEGARLVPPIHAQALFSEATPNRAKIFRNLYLEDHPPETDSQISSRAPRPAYDPRSLSRVWSEGIRSNGTALSPLMPRFQLNQTDQQNLIAYLQQLGERDEPGVDDSVIHFGAVVAGEVDPGQKRALLDVLHTFADCHNLEVERYRSRPRRSINYKREFTHTLRTWRIHLWELKGPESDWQAQLAQLHQSRPVFALISGISGKSWNPIHEFCEQEEIPCVFPNTGVPNVASNHYTLYFHRGVYDEARLMVDKLLSETGDANNRSVTQVYDSSPAGLAGHAELERLLEGRVKIVSHAIDTDSHQHGLRQPPSLTPPDSDLVVWANNLEHPTIARLLSQTDRDSIAIASRLAVTNPNPPKRPDLFVVQGTQARQPNTPDQFRVRRWLSSRRIYSARDETLQLNAYFSLLLTQHALRHMVDDFDQDYLMEWLEHECESALNPGVFKRLSLGPGQRFATRLKPVDQSESHSHPTNKTGGE